MSEYLPGEREDMEHVIALAERWGYGRVIQIVQNAWSKKEREAGSSRELADIVSGLICVWCKTDRRTGKQAKPEEP